MRIILSLALCMGISLSLSAGQPPTPDQVLRAMHQANDYFIRQHPDPTVPTFVKKERPSNLWTRGVYFEGLMALNRIDLRASNKEYVCQWAAFHRFTPRNGVYTRDADDYCCCQTYLEMMEQADIYLNGPSVEEALLPTVQCMDNLLHPAPENMYCQR